MSSSLGVNFAWCVPKSCRICSQPATSHSDFHRLPLHDIARGLPERRTNELPTQERRVSSSITSEKRLERAHHSQQEAAQIVDERVNGADVR